MLGRVIAAIGGVVVLVLFTALIAPFFVEWSSFRTEFEQQASRILGKKVTVQGDVDARILPFPSITMHDVRVGQDFDGQPQVQVARFSMDMELAPFLSGEARIFDMRIEGPKARVRILKDGTLDWLRGSRASIPTRVVVIEDVHLVDAQIDIVDEQSGRSRKVTALTASLSAASLAGPWRGDGNATLDGEEARFSLTTGSVDGVARRLPMRLRLWPDSEPLEVNLDGELTVAEGSPAYKGSFAAHVLQEEDESEPVTAPPPGPRAKGSFELANDRIRIPDYRLEVGPVDDPYVVTGEATLDTGRKAEFLLTAEGQQIDVNRLGESATVSKTGRDPAATAQRRLHAFIEMAASIPIPPVPGRANLKLPAVVLNDTTIRDIQLDVRPSGRGWTVDKAVATLPGRTRLEASGALMLQGRASFVGEMLVASTQPSGLADWLSGRVDPAIRQLRTAGFSAKVALTPELQRFQNLELAVGAAILRGGIERQSPAGQTPNLSLNLNGDEIDLDAMQALASLITGDDAGRDVLDHRLAASLRADRFTAFGVAAENVDTAFTISGGTLSLERLTVGNLAGTNLTGEGRVEGSLLSYSGSGTLRLRSADPSAFIDLLRQRLPVHPVVERLARNARYFSDADLSADLSLGQRDEGASVAIKGRINGSVVDAEINLPNILDLTGANPLRAKLTLENPRSEILLAQTGLEILPFGGDGPGTLQLTVDQSGEDPARVSGDYRTPGTTVQVSGTASLRSQDFGQGQSQIKVASQDLEPYLLLTGVGIPQFGGGLPATVEADVTVTEKAIDVTRFRGSINGNAIDGRLAIDRTNPKFKGAGALDIDTADLSWLGEAVFGPLIDPATGKPSSKPVSTPIFGDSELELAFKAGRVAAGEFGDLSSVSGKLVNRGGAISIEEAAADWKGGKVSGRLLMSSGGGTGILQTKLHAEAADLSSVVWMNDGQPVANGRFSLDASAEASGDSVQELWSGVSGSGEIQFSRLSVIGLNPHLLDTLMAAADGMKKEITEAQVRAAAQSALHQGVINLPPLQVPFTITGGGVRVQEVRAQSGGTVVSVEGQSDLASGRLQGSLSLTFDAGRDAIAGGDPTLRLRYSGDRSSPVEQVDVSALTNYLTMRAFEQERRRVEMLQSSVLEKQRLRREVALYNFKAAERAAREAAEKARIEEEQREKQAIIDAARNAEAERQRQADSLKLQVPPTDDNLGSGAGPVQPFGMGTLPGVGQ